MNCRGEIRGRWQTDHRDKRNAKKIKQSSYKKSARE